MSPLPLLARYWPAAIGALLLAALAGMYLLWQGAEHRADALAVSLRAAEAEIAAADRRSAALERAAAERAVDTADLATHDEEISDAIAKAAVPGTAPGPTSLVLGCDRLRRQGSTASPEYRRLCGGR